MFTKTTAIKDPAECYQNILNGKFNNYEQLICLLYDKYNNLSFIEYLQFLLRPENIELLKSGILKNGQLELTFSQLVTKKNGFSILF